MTVDELIDLTEALFTEVGFSLESLRLAHVPDPVGCLTDEQFLLAVRFLAGERPTASERRRTGAERHLDDRVGPITKRLAGEPLSPEAEDEFARRLAEIEELDEETPVGAIDLGDGVTLGFD